MNSPKSKTSSEIDSGRSAGGGGPDLKLSSLLEPRYVLELARLLDENGDRTAARIEYRRFLDFWTHADAQLPELAEARVALASR